MSSVKILAKDMVRSRAYIARFIEMKAHLSAVSLKMQTIKSNEAMSDAMKGVTKALVAMNKKMSLPALQKMMRDFMTENERAEMTQEAVGDTLDDAFEEEGSSAEEERIVGQVLAELGVNVSNAVPEAPSSTVASETKQQAVRLGEPVSASDPGMTELEERLKNLKQK
jgi:charged multivesicular body protein 2A